MLLMLHLLSALALVLVVVLVATQLIAYQSFKNSAYDSPDRVSYHPLPEYVPSPLLAILQRQSSKCAVR
jgi:hypothetical protein